MKLFYLDSADPAAIRTAMGMGVISGVTTNPSILKQSAGDGDAVDSMRNLLELYTDGSVFHQIHAPNAKAGLEQVKRLSDGLKQPERIVFKLPAQAEWFAFGAHLLSGGHRVAFTAVYHAGQYLAAAQVGAEFVIPYVDRARRLRPSAEDVVEQLARHRTSGSPLILAASVKSAEQAVEAFRMGADAITTTVSVLEDLMQDDLTDSAVEQFLADVPW